MSNDEADALMEDFDKWNARQAKQAFLHRMERKLGRKQRYARQ